MPGTKEPLGPDVPDAEVAAHRRRGGLPDPHQGRGRRRRQGHAHGGPGGGPCRAPSAPRGPRRSRRSAIPRIYVERRIVRPRHIEIQLLGDHHGTVVPFVERECSIQRRHQKVVEESPSPVVTPDLRRRMAGAAGRRRPARRLLPTPGRSSSCSTSPASSSSSR
ncbi:MAG: hypothetical protein MZV64_13700 [Ignavibacteriales bacterium]|nr:hypothetical protein [Ignavibacteriales bacterium]